MKQRHHIRRWAAGLLAVCCLSFAAPIPALAAGKPAKPAITSARLSGKYTAKLTWKKAARAKQYEIICSVNGGKFRPLKKTAARACTHKKLKPGRTYAYKVRALNGKAKSPFSGVKKIRTLSAGKPKVKASASGTAITLSWSKVKNATGYRVYKKTKSGYKLIGITKQRSYKVKKLALNTKYTFKVTPYVSNYGSKTNGNGAVLTVRSAKSAYLLDLMQPYQTPGYKDFSKTSFLMGGNSYSHGFYIYGGSIYFNLKGNYQTLSFVAGIPDQDSGTSKVYVSTDGKKRARYIFESGKLPEKNTVNVKNCKQLEIHAEGFPWTAFANVKVSR